MTFKQWEQTLQEHFVGSCPGVSITKQNSQNSKHMPKTWKHNKTRLFHLSNDLFVSFFIIITIMFWQTWLNLYWDCWPSRSIPKAKWEEKEASFWGSEAGVVALLIWAGNDNAQRAITEHKIKRHQTFLKNVDFQTKWRETQKKGLFLSSDFPHLTSA